MSVERRTLPVGLPLAVARGSGRGAAVLMVPSAFGVAPDVESQLEELAADALLAVAPDPFWRVGGGVIPYGDMPGVLARLGALDREQLVGDLAAAAGWLREQGAERVVMLGVCFGGPFALRLAADRVVDAIATWHGSRMDQHLARVAEIGCPVRFHFGGADPLVPLECVERVRAAFRDHPDAEIVVHPGASHGFSHRSAPPYQPAAERAGMDAVRALVCA